MVAGLNYAGVRLLGRFEFIRYWGSSGSEDTMLLCLLCAFTSNALALSITVWGIPAALGTFRRVLVVWTWVVAVLWWTIALGGEYLRCLGGAILGAAIGSVFADMMVPKASALDERK